MGKQRTIEEIEKGERNPASLAWGNEKPMRFYEGEPIYIFADHYKLNLKHMSPGHAAANAHDAVQRYLATLKEEKAGDDGTV